MINFNSYTYSTRYAQGAVRAAKPFSRLGFGTKKEVWDLPLKDQTIFLGFFRSQNGLTISDNVDASYSSNYPGTPDILVEQGNAIIGNNVDLPIVNVTNGSFEAKDNLKAVKIKATQNIKLGKNAKIENEIRSEHGEIYAEDGINVRSIIGDNINLGKIDKLEFIGMDASEDDLEAQLILKKKSGIEPDMDPKKIQRVLTLRDENIPPNKPTIMLGRVDSEFPPLIIKTPTKNHDILDKFNFRIISNEPGGIELHDGRFMRDYNGRFAETLQLVKVEKI